MELFNNVEIQYELYYVIIMTYMSYYIREYVICDLLVMKLYILQTIIIHI